MNEIDKKIFRVLSDYSGIENYNDISGRLTQIKNEALSHLDNKEYSDINVQDEHGNTMLHHAFESQNLNLIEKILKLGADPKILNKKEKNVYLSSRSYGFMYNFWKKYENYQINDEFLIKVQDYHINFKQDLYNNKISEGKTFGVKNNHQLENILREIDLLNVDSAFLFFEKQPIFSIKNFCGFMTKHFELNEKNRLKALSIMVKKFDMIEDHLYCLVFELLKDPISLNQNCVRIVNTYNINEVNRNDHIKEFYSLFLQIAKKNNWDLEKKFNNVSIQDVYRKNKTLLNIYLNLTLSSDDIKDERKLKL